MMRQDRYNTGWNDLAHAILTWTPGCSEKYADERAYCVGMQDIAVQCAHEHGDDGYYSGVRVAAAHYLTTGCIERKLVA